MATGRSFEIKVLLAGEWRTWYCPMYSTEAEALMESLATRYPSQTFRLVTTTQEA